MKFYTQFDRPAEGEIPLEVHEDEGKVERTGYMETEKMVNGFLVAGERLKMFRGAEYAPDEEVPFDAPVARFGSEMDAILAMREVNTRLNKARIEADKAAEEAAKKALEAKDERAKEALEAKDDKAKEA